MSIVISGAPVVFDVLGFVTSSLQGEPTFEAISLPQPLLPAFSECDAACRSKRTHYFISLWMQTFLLCCILGTLLTEVRNRWQQYRAEVRNAELQRSNSEDLEKSLTNKSSYRELACHTSDESGHAPNKAQSALPVCVAKVYLPIKVFVHMMLISGMCYWCVLSGTVNPQRGVGYEVWTVWGTWNCISGLIEVVLSACLRGPDTLPRGLYPKAMAMTMVPILSEKVDTAKDVVLVAVACSVDDYTCAALMALPGIFRHL
eukprot:TRINITY_DN13051_c0_g1_i6.p1 TRINITY_DN13051_c0_g1~~TRINITY_DN13051_c0_g1_i6.p1  ORF type:complete len:259 (+),score=3.00 TRINITY_DN13051_c0_g1_i6:123-899(+)